jgi:hypothetical protein
MIWYTVFASSTVSEGRWFLLSVLQDRDINVSQSELGGKRASRRKVWLNCLLRCLHKKLAVSHQRSAPSTSSIHPAGRQTSMIGKEYCLEYTDIPEVLFRHIT